VVGDEIVGGWPSWALALAWTRPPGCLGLLLLAAVVRVVGSVPRAGSVPGFGCGARHTSCGALPGKRLGCRNGRRRSNQMTQSDDRPIRWGILGTGGIAHAFAQDLALQSGCEVVAIGSRARASADAFGDECGVPHRHASYQALVSDPDVDVVYVATPQGHCTALTRPGLAVTSVSPVQAMSHVPECSMANIVQGLASTPVFMMRLRLSAVRKRPSCRCWRGRILRCGC
jgi:Oxidoreductase family, NAD-binding Rossmann fold